MPKVGNFLTLSIKLYIYDEGKVLGQLWYLIKTFIIILAAEREAQIEAFLDQIEGETLGEMMNYLSSELESTTFGHHEAAAAALESTTSGGDGGNGSADNEKKPINTNSDVDVVPSKREKDGEEKIYNEITKLTRSTVDRYVWDIYIAYY